MADSCASLAAEIAALRAEIARIPRVDKNELIQATRSALMPDVNTAVVAGGVVIGNKLKPQIDAAFQKSSDALIELAKNTQQQRLLEIEARGASQAATQAEQVAANYAKEMRIGLQNLDTNIAKIGRENTTTALKVNQIESTAAQLEGEIKQVGATAGNALNKAGEALSQGAKNARDVLNAANEASGAKALANGLKGRLGQLSEALVKIEAKVGEAILKAANAVGISGEALAATGRLAGRVLEIFNTVATLATLIEQLAILNVLGGRIDAVESAIITLGRDVSRVLGQLFRLTNRVGQDENLITQAKNIAISAEAIGQNASLKAGEAQVTATRAENFAHVVDGKAKAAQLTADGAVRNATVANDNAVAANRKATNAQLTADGAAVNATQANENATTAYKKANEAESIGTQAKHIAGEALGKAGQGLQTALVAIALYQSVKALRGLPGIPGIRGLPGIPGRNANTIVNNQTIVVNVPGRPGTPGRDGRNGTNGINGRNATDVNPAQVADLKLFILQQHNQTRSLLGGLIGGVKNSVLAVGTVVANTANQIVGGANLALLTIINNKLGNQVVGGISGLVETVAKNAYVDKFVQLLTLAATLHNALMLSNNLGQTLGGIINTILGLILPKGIDGTPLNINEILGKTAIELITLAIGEDNYKKLSEDWAKANRIYQATANVFNSLTNFSNTIISGLEIIGGTVGKIGNSLRKWGVVGDNAFQFFNPQPNFHNKAFIFLENANNEANTIQNVVNVPVSIGQAATDLNNSTEEFKKAVSQDKDAKSGVPVPEAKIEKEKQKIATDASKGLVFPDFFDTSSLQWISNNDGGSDG